MSEIWMWIMSKSLSSDYVNEVCDALFPPVNRVGSPDPGTLPALLIESASKLIGGVCVAIQRGEAVL